MPGVFPDYPGPVVRNDDGEREWIPGDEHPNTSSPRWRSWFSAENRCLVPANSFAEYARSRTDNKKTDVVWFGLLRRFPAPIGWARLRPGFVELGLKESKSHRRGFGWAGLASTG